VANIRTTSLAATWAAERPSYALLVLPVVHPGGITRSAGKRSYADFIEVSHTSLLRPVGSASVNASLDNLQRARHAKQRHKVIVERFGMPRLVEAIGKVTIRQAVFWRA
jgi:hypothetical protein